jgi:hypothetical protein
MAADRSHHKNEAKMEFPDLDPRSVQSLIKSGGKKKLDTLIEMLKTNAPQRLKELQAAGSPEEAKAVARVLKTSASNLGLAALEDVCDQIIEGKTWTAGSPLAKDAQVKYQAGLAALVKVRGTI